MPTDTKTYITKYNQQKTITTHTMMYQYIYNKETTTSHNQ